MPARSDAMIVASSSVSQSRTANDQRSGLRAPCSVSYPVLTARILYHSPTARPAGASGGDRRRIPLKHHLQENPGSNHDQTDGEERQLQAEELAHAHRQCDESCDEAEAAHGDPVDTADGIEPQEDEPGGDKPAAVRNLALGKQPDGTDHDQKRSPAEALQTPVQSTLSRILINRDLILLSGH